MKVAILKYNDRGENIYINLESIKYLTPSKGGNETIIHFIDNTQIPVKERPETIAQKMKAN